MLRFLNIAVLSLLVTSAGWAYKTKYETISYGEQVKKLESRVERQKDQIAILKAEWQHLNRPSRMEQLAEQYAPDLKPIKPVQIGRANTLPERSRAPVDQIATKLDSLGLTTGSIGTPAAAKKPNATPLAAKPRPAATPIPKAAKPAATPIAKLATAAVTPKAAKPAASLAAPAPTARAPSIRRAANPPVAGPVATARPPVPPQNILPPKSVVPPKSPAR